jgi:hypothetical protein
MVTPVCIVDFLGCVDWRAISNIVCLTASSLSAPCNPTPPRSLFRLVLFHSVTLAPASQYHRPYKLLTSIAPANPALPQTHSSLPTSPLDHITSHKDTRTPTDPTKHDRISFFPQAALTEHARLSNSPPNNISNLPSDLLAPYPTQLTLAQPPPFGSAPDPTPSSPDQGFWDLDQVKPGVVLFSTGPVMSKPPSGHTSNTDPARRSSVDRSHWATPSGVPSSNVSRRVFLWLGSSQAPTGRC